VPKADLWGLPPPLLVVRDRLGQQHSVFAVAVAGHAEMARGRPFKQLRTIVGPRSLDDDTTLPRPGG